jgi:DNA-binding GntR family transcriptional regulator
VPREWTWPFERLERSTVRLADFVYRQIFDAVVSGQIPPGERLVQEVLAEEMDVSRTPVREALLRLETEGILEASERGGFLVRSLDLDEVRATYELRAAVEGYSARLVAERGDPAPSSRSGRRSPKQPTAPPVPRRATSSTGGFTV